MQRRRRGQLPGITAYMLGALVPVLAAVLVMRAIARSWNIQRRASVQPRMRNLADATTRRVFSTLNSVVRPAVKAGLGNPFPIGTGTLVLETTGRRSGLPRLVPVLSTRAGNTLTVSTVRGDSQWIRNAEADSNVAVWLGGQRREAVATVRRGHLNTVRLDLVDRAA